MPPLREEELLVQKDARELERLGYTQELLRGMGGFSNFAISFFHHFNITRRSHSFRLRLNYGWPPGLDGDAAQCAGRFGHPRCDGDSLRAPLVHRAA